jgi:hypothetical protein
MSQLRQPQVQPETNHLSNQIFPPILADEDVSIHHPLRMYGKQTVVPYGCTYLLSWGWRFMVK